MLGSAEDYGLALIILSLVFALAALIRRWSRPLRALFIPTAVIGGFLMLGLGPEGVGRLTGGPGLFPPQIFGIWKALPGLLINVMCASLLLGERLPPLPKVWTISGSHVIAAFIMSAGQFAIAGLLTMLVLEPVFGFSSKAGALIEMSFAGGHGTLAGLTPVLVQYDAGDLLEVGLGLATIGMVTGIVIGTMLVNYAIRSPSISVARQTPTSPDEDLDIDHHLPGPDDKPLDEWSGMTQVTAAAVFLGVSIAAGIVLLEVFRWAFGLMGSAFFEKFPLFPFTIVGGVLVQLCAVRFRFEWALNRLAIEGLGGLATDGIVICAIGTLSLAALGAHIGPLILLAAASVAWSVFLTMVLARRLFPRNWFEHAIAEFGESQGNVATGFVMVDMIDPGRQTDVTRDYSYRQLITRPLIGGGFVTALAVPLIASWGLPVFTVASAAATLVLIVWGAAPNGDHRREIHRRTRRIQAAGQELIALPGTNPMRSAAPRVLFVLLFAMAPATLAAQTGDVVEVASGERINGDVTRLQHGQLEFRTARGGPGRPRFAGTIWILWSEVVRFASAKQLDVELSSGERFSGSLSSPSPRRLIVQTANGPSRALDFDDVIGIIPIESGFRGRTTGSIDFGLSYGNAQNARTFILDANARHNSPAYRYETHAVFDSWLSARDDAGRLTRNTLAIDVRRRLSNRWFALATTALQQDEPLQLNVRFMAGGGLGRRLLHTNRGVLSVEGGLDYDGEDYEDRSTFDHTAEVFGGIDGDWFVNGGTTDASAAARTFISLARQRARLQLRGQVRRDLAWDLYAAFNIQENFDSDPPDDRPRSDLGVSVSIGWTF